MKLDPNATYTIAPVQAPAGPPKPEFIRPPKSGQRCPYTGLSRPYLYTLISPSKANGYNPPVQSVSLRPKGKATGVRLIHYDSLLKYLYRKMEEQNRETKQ